MDKENQAIEIFRQMADAISARYMHEVAAMKLLYKERPGFDQIKEKLVELDKMLIDRGVWLIELYKKEGGLAHDILTEECKKIIALTIEQFVKGL